MSQGFLLCLLLHRWNRGIANIINFTSSIPSLWRSKYILLKKKEAYHSSKWKPFQSFDQNTAHSGDWCKPVLLSQNNKDTTFLGGSLVCMFDKCSPAALQSRPAARWRLQRPSFQPLSCYWAVNSADGSCLCVLIRCVTLNLGIDTWGAAERGVGGGGVAIYRPSIMTFIDDVTTGARGVEVGAPSLNGHPVCSCVIVCAHVHTQSNSMSVCVCVPPLTADLMAAILSFPRQMVHWTMSLAEYSWPL